MSSFRSIAVPLLPLMILISLCVPAGEVCAQQIPFEVPVRISESSTEIPFSSLPGFDASTVLVEAASLPAHGSLQTHLSSFTYDFGDEFWRRGGDSFSYTLTQFGSPKVTATVSLVATFYGEYLLLSDDFETGPGDPGSLVGPVTEDPQMALTGDFGLMVSAGSSDPDAYKAWIIDQLGVNQGNRIRGGILPPDDPILLTGFSETVILSAKSGTSSRSLMKVWLRNDHGVLSLRGEAQTDPGAWVSTPWQSIDSLPHQLDINWWPESALYSGGQGGFYLWVDELLVGGFRLDQDFDSGRLEFRLGFQDHSGVSMSMGFDPFNVYNGGPVPAATIDTVESFEDPATSSWTPFPALATSTQILASGAITGELGVSADLGAAQGLTEYFLDSSPKATEAYNASFLLDTSNTQQLACDSIQIFNASDGDTFSGSKEHIKLLLRKDCAGGKDFQIRIRGRHGTATGSGQWQDSPWFPLNDGVHSLEIAWKAAVPRAATGYVRLWLDGIFTTEVGALANQDRRVEAVLLGTLGIAAGSTGELAFDDFTSWSPAPMPEIP